VSHATNGGTRCRACERSELAPFLSLGRTPLANALLTREQLGASEPTYPLDVTFCPGCTLVQITETVPPERLFSEYLYFSSFSDALLAHARALALGLKERYHLGSESLVVEIASNDGYLLRNFVEAGVPVLGIEPARNIAQVASERGVETVNEFFSESLAGRLVESGRRADVIIANNVMAHVPDITGVLRGIAHLLKPGGAFVMETPYLHDLLEHLEFDTIYHEHLFYYSMTALARLFRQCGLAASHVERVPIHGGSLRVTAVLSSREGDAPTVRALLDEERAWGVAEPATYQGFARRVETLQHELKDLLVGLKGRGCRLAAYGAAAKGSTLLNSLGLEPGVLDFVVDRSTYKQGRYMPGVHLPVHPPERLLDEQPDYVLLLSWNFADEIMHQQEEYRRRGGRFIVPIPRPSVV
jgi:SAM-dependent methyltransferase